MEKRTGGRLILSEKVNQEANIAWKCSEKKKTGEDLLKNMGVAAALVLCAVTLRSGAVPQLSSAADTVLASVAGDTLLDDQLGKLSFVSAMFPEATLVFGEAKQERLAIPVNAGTLNHVWSDDEPYVSWQTQQRDVYASGDGVVMGIYHGDNEERLIQVMGPNKVTCIYGNIKETTLMPGSTVHTGDILGQLLDDAECTLEVYVDGISVDPAEYLSSVQ